MLVLKVGKQTVTIETIGDLRQALDRYGASITDNVLRQVAPSQYNIIQTAIEAWKQAHETPPKTKAVEKIEHRF